MLDPVLIIDARANAADKALAASVKQVALGAARVLLQPDVRREAYDGSN